MPLPVAENVPLQVTGAPQRLDQFLVEHWPEPIGRRPLAALLASADVRVNGRRATKSTRVQAGDEVLVRLAPTAPRPVVDATLPLVHESPTLIAVDKPPAMPSTEGRSAAPSVAALLVDRYPEMAGLDTPRSGGLVHRLDTGTSGLLLAARNADTHAALRQAFRARSVGKHYVAFVRGRLTHARSIEQPLRRHPRSRGRMLPGRSGQRRTWPATTRVRPLHSADDVSLVHLSMQTGVTHQLRAHLALIGHPVLGDRRYRSTEAPPLTARLEARLAPSWHFLHAAAITLELPGSPDRLQTTIPSHWRRLLADLEWSLEIADLT